MNTFDELDRIDQKIEESYLRRGFVKSKDDLADLHMSYSPYRVPRGLTKLQIRRRINKFIRNGRKLDNSLLFTNRLNVTVNGKLILGASFTGEVPTNRRQLKRLLKKVMI